MSEQRISSSFTSERFSFQTAFLWLLVVVFLVSALRAVFLIFNQTDLFFDEAQYWSWGLEPAAGYFSKPPVLSWVIRATTEVCGTGEACVRLTSVLLYGLMALVAAFLGRELASEENKGLEAFWAGVLALTIPGVSFATRLVSTDAALLLFWALSLLFSWRLAQRKNLLDAILLGASLGLGFLSKYAIVFFFPCALLWVILSKEGRRAFLNWQILITAVVGLLVLLPNILWNASNDWITFRHTKDNGNWQGLQFNWDNLGEFLGTQIGILGPVLAIAVLIAVLKRRTYWSPTYTFCLCFSLPVIALIAGQAFISRAHGNWAAVAFVSLSVLSALILVRWRAKSLLALTMALHLIVIGALGFVDMNAKALLDDAPGRALKRLFGWSEMMEQLKPVIADKEVKTVIAYNRESAAQSLYYLRDTGVTVRVWPKEGIPGHHYELAYALSGQDKGPFIVLDSCPSEEGRDGRVSAFVREGFTRQMNYRVLDEVEVGSAPSC